MAENSENQNSSKKSKITKNEELKMIYMRSFLKKIEKNFIEKDNLTKNLQ